MPRTTNGVLERTIDDDLNTISDITDLAPDIDLEPFISELEYHQRSLEIRQSIWTCENCVLHRKCLEPVAMLGEVVRPTLVALGEAPGRHEDEQGIGFTGVSGQLLRHSAKKVGVEIGDYLNTCCCRPPGNRTPEIEEVMACAPNLDAQIGHLKPWMILTFGNVPLMALTNNSNLKITQCHGVFYTTRFEKIWGYSFFHPSYVLRNIEIARAVPQDDEHNRQIKRAELVVQKWKEDWERLGHMMVFRNELGADIVESYRNDFLRDKLDKVLREVIKKEPFQPQVNPWRDDVKDDDYNPDEIPF